MTQIKLGAGWYSTDIMTLSVDKKVSITITRKYNSKKQALSADQQKTWTLSFDDKDAPSYYKVK